MANTVESTIKVNVEANTQNAENSINRVSTEFKELQGITEDINKSNKKLIDNEEITTGINKINELVKKYDQLFNTIYSFKFSSQDKQIAAFSLLENLDAKADDININNYKQRVNELEQVQKQFDGLKSTKNTNNFSNSGITENSISRLKEYNDGLSSIVSELKNVSKSSTISNNDKLSKLDEYKNKLENIRTGLINLRNENNKNGLGNTKVEESLSKLTKLDNIIYRIKDNISNTGNNSGGLFDKFLNTDISNKMQNVFKDINNEMFKGSTKSFSDLIGGTRAGKDVINVVDKIKGLPGYIQAAAVALTPVIIAWKHISKEVGRIYDKIVKISENVIKAFPSTVINAFLDSVNTAINALGFVKDQIVEIISKMKELSEEAKNTQQSFFTLYNYLGAKSGEQVVDFNKSLSLDKGVDINEITSAMKGLQGSLSNMNLNSEEIEKYNRAFEGLMLDLSKFDGSNLEEVSGQLEAAISFSVLNSRSALAKAMDLTHEQIEQFKKLTTVEERAQWILGHWDSVAGTYDRWLDTSAGKVQTLQNSWNNFMSQIQQLALGIYAVFAPVLTHLINMFTVLGEHINKIFGTSTETAKANNAKNILKQSSAIDKLTKSTDNNTKANVKNRNKNNIASFDDIISLNKDNSNKDDTKQKAKNLIDLSKLLEDNSSKIKKARTEWDKYRDSIKKALDSKNYEKAGLLLSEYLESLLNIDWDTIKAKFKDGATAIAKFLNGIFGNEQTFMKLGTDIAEVLNTVFITLDAFFTNLDFSQVGDSLAKSFNSFTESFDTEKAAKTLADVFKGIINIVSGFILNIDRTKVIKNINEFIYSLFNNFTSVDADKAAKAVLKGLADVITIVGTSIYDVVSNAEFGNIVGTIFEDISTWVGDNGEQIGKNISDIIAQILDIFNTQILSEENIDNIIKGVEGFIEGLFSNEDAIIEKLGLIIDKIIGMLEKWRTDGTLQKITDFILRVVTETNLPDLIFNIIQIQSEIKATLFIGKVITKVRTFFSFLGELLKPIGDIFGRVIETALNLFKEIYSGAKDIFGRVGKFIKGIVDGIYGAFKEIRKKIKDIIDTVIGWIEGLIEKIQGAFKTVKEITGSIKKKISGGIGGAFDKISDIIPNNIFNIQAHATGGITNGPSIGLIGEQGKEAVLPLERGNTLQMLGNAILNSATVNKTQQSKSNNINVNISGFNKEFYTKAEVKNIANGIADILVQGGYSLT